MIALAEELQDIDLGDQRLNPHRYPQVKNLLVFQHVKSKVCALILLRKSDLWVTMSAVPLELCGRIPQGGG